MSEIMTNFRASDMPGAKKVEPTPAPKKVAPKAAPKPVEVVKEVVEEVAVPVEAEDAPVTEE
jgi:ribosomal protein L13E